MPQQAPTALKKINLALQGGGAHGAFTWGVLDKLLEDGRLGFDGLSGTSAGAMNAVVMADGLREGGLSRRYGEEGEMWGEGGADKRFLFFVRRRRRRRRRRRGE